MSKRLRKAWKEKQNTHNTMQKDSEALVRSVDNPASLTKRLAVLLAAMLAVAVWFRGELTAFVTEQDNDAAAPLNSETMSDDTPEIPLNERPDANPGEETGHEIDDGSAEPIISEQEAEAKFTND